MPSPFQGISTMNTALRAFQRALDVTGNNITNVNTPGYSRQSIQINEVDPSVFATTGGAFFLGNGVSVESVSRIQDKFLYMRQLQATGENSRLGTLNQGLSSVQSIMNEPGGSGVSDALSQLFNSFSALGSSPNDDALKLQVQQAGATLTSRVRDLYAGLQAQVKQTTGQIGATIQQAQGLVNTIAEMNKQIVEQQVNGAQPNDLLDARDQAVQQLGQILPVTSVPQQDGSVMLFSGQLTLVEQGRASTIPTTLDLTTGSLTSGSVSYPVPSGTLAGLFQTSQKISGYEQQLDTFANTLRTQFNSIHQTGTNSLGNTGVNFFNDSTPQTGAIDFDLDAAVKADPKAIVTGVTGNAGDGGLALSLSGLRDQKIATLGNATFGDFYGGIVTGVGQDVATASNQSNTSTAIMQQIGQQIQSVSGVSLDDEMSNMLRYQRSYQAAAKALSIFDQTTEDLINIIQ